MRYAGREEYLQDRFLKVAVKDLIEKIVHRAIDKVLETPGKFMMRLALARHRL
jgi:hypothetical protein